MRAILAQVASGSEDGVDFDRRKSLWSASRRLTCVRIPGRGETGASLVEILVAVAIVSLSLVVLIAALSTAAFAVRTSHRLTTATNLATAQLESVKADAYADVAAGAHTAVSAPSGYTVAVGCSEVVTGLLQVTVTVSYQGETLVAVSNYKVDR